MKIFLFLSFLFVLASCQDPVVSTDTPVPTSSSGVAISNETVSGATMNNDKVYSTSTGANGEILPMTFDTTKDTVTVVWSGEIIEMKGNHPGSGIWYKNDEYELRGKGEDIELSKNGVTLFKH